MNFRSSYLKTVFNIRGIHTIHEVAMNGASSGKQLIETSIDLSQQKLRALIAQPLNY